MPLGYVCARAVLHPAGAAGLAVLRCRSGLLVPHSRTNSLTASHFCISRVSFQYGFMKTVVIYIVPHRYVRVKQQYIARGHSSCRLHPKCGVSDPRGVPGECFVTAETKGGLRHALWWTQLAKVRRACTSTAAPWDDPRNPTVAHSAVPKSVGVRVCRVIEGGSPSDVSVDPCVWRCVHRYVRALVRDSWDTIPAFFMWSFDVLK